MENKVIHRIKTISEYHRVMGLARPGHPQISVIDYRNIKLPCKASMSLVFDFYSVCLDRNFRAKMKYGQQQGDFEEGVLFFMSPGQVFEIELPDEEVTNRSGWVLLLHPDFLWKTALAKTIRGYEYFSYAVNESLFLSGREEEAIENILKNIVQEYQANIDIFSQSVIIAQLELLFTYAGRYYHRQFFTRRVSSHSILNRLEEVLDKFTRSDALNENGIPTVQIVAAVLNISPGYLSGLLKVLTGQSTQSYIHDKLIGIAKEKLSTTSLTISEIAYELGFEHPQSFSRLFKSRTNYSPLEFRASFN
jgi:AraC family transcriptional activator of pobA